jgi:hypothetical protein
MLKRGTKKAKGRTAIGLKKSPRLEALAGIFLVVVVVGKGARVDDDA